MRQNTLQSIAASLVALLCYATATFAQPLWVPSAISDGMVVQQQKPIRIWGTAKPQAQVSVSIKLEENTVATATSAADSAGQWLAELDPLDASFQSYVISISDGSSTIEIKDVLVGEVWLASGQSNMHLPVEFIIGREKYLAEAANRRIRIFNQEATSRGKFFADPQRDVGGGRWQIADSPKGLHDVSGITYTFELDLFGALNRDGKHVPVAFLNTALGATSIQAWISGQRTHADPILDAKYPKQWLTETDGKSFNQATALFNHRIAPLAPMQIRGILWSQGENNVGSAEGAAYYRVALAALIEDWRQQFRAPEAPFIAAQLHPQFYWDDLASAAYLREAQIDACANVTKAVAIPIHDVSLAWNDGPFKYKSPIHPLDKAPVGRRMSAAALGLAYGKAIPYLPPTFTKIKIEGERAIISFVNVEGGLMIADGDTALRGFTVCGSDRVFVPADAVIVRDAVQVSSPLIRQPVAVAYGFTSVNNVANLSNGDGLPASPFRTDRKPSTYFHPQHWMECDTLQQWINTRKDAAWVSCWQATANNDGSSLRFTLDTKNKTHGSASLRIDFPAGGAIAFHPVLTSKLDLSPFKAITCDVFNPDPIARTLVLKLGDRINTSCTLPPGPNWSTAQFSLDRATPANADRLKSIESVHISAAPADGSGYLLLDHFQFVP